MNYDLRPYQDKIARAILNSIFYHKGLTFSVEIARQGGKNELSSHLERFLLTININNPLQLVKCSPTFKPQTLISMTRLKDRLNDIGLYGWTSESGYIIRLGEARAVFLSADVGSHVVGNTAHLLLEIDESQDVTKDKFTKEFKPMGASTNCTVVHYGTTWDDSTLLEEVKQTNLELEKKDGIQRHFRYDWQEVAKYNLDYLNYVESERHRLGENHPLFLTQYRLLPIHGGGGFLNSTQVTQILGNHPRLHHPADRIVLNTGTLSSPFSETRSSKLEAGSSKVYVAGIDLAGEAETGDDIFLRTLNPRRDSTVITIAELTTQGLTSPYGRSDPEKPFINPDSNPLYPFLNQSLCIKVVEHYSWVGARHTDLYPKMVDLLKNVWHCKRIVVDSTGVGEPVASFLRGALGSRVVPFKFTARSKSDLGFNLLAAINSGRLKIYAADGSPEYQEMMMNLTRAKSVYRPNQTLNFFVDPRDGHDDFLMSLALVVEAAGLYQPRTAKGSGTFLESCVH